MIHQNIKKQPRDSILYSITLVILIDSIVYGLIFPILPQLFFNRTLGLNLPSGISVPVLYSLTLATYPIAQFFGMAFFGAMSDKYEKQILLLAGIGGLVSSYMLSTFAVLEHSLGLFLISRCVSGFLGGIYSVGDALICDISGHDSKKRMNNFRLPVLANKLGAVLGPALAIFVTTNTFISNQLVIPFCITAALALLNFVLFYYNFKHNRIKKTNIDIIKKQSFSLSDFFKGMHFVFQTKSTRLLALSFLAYQLATGLFMQGLSLYLTIDFDYQTKQLGLFSSVMSALIIVSAYSVKYFSKFNSALNLLKIFLSFLVALFFYAYGSNLLHDHILYNTLIRTWIMASLFYLTLPFFKLIFITVFSDKVSDENQGLAMGAVGQISILGYIISSLCVGHIVLYHYILPITAILFLISFVFIFLFKDQKK